MGEHRRRSPRRPPTDPASFTFVALDTRTPYTLHFAGTDDGWWQERQLSATLGEPDRREGSVERDGHGDDWGVVVAIFLLTWNPDRFHWDDFAATVADVQRGAGAALTGTSGWSVGVRKHGIGPGDRFFMLRQGVEPKGIIGSGTIDSEVEVYDHWTGRGTQNAVDVTFQTLADAEQEPERIIPITDLIRRFRDRYYFQNVQASGWKLPDDVAEELEAWWRERYGEPEGPVDSARLAEELPEDQEYFEGAVRRIKINAYERNAAARRACIAHHGTTCRVCGFNFEAAYGELGRDYIHVHHLKRLSKIAERYRLDPIRHLCPICPNCHAMIHRQEPPLKIRDLRRVVNEMRERRRQQRLGRRKIR